jgi:hypothetical protein
MKRTGYIMLVALGAVLLPFKALAQETNSYPKTRLENFEATTGAVLIRGTDEMGVVPGKFGGVTVKCREVRNAATNQREFGAIVTVTQAEGLEDTTYVDYEEMDALVRAIDYVTKVDWSVSSMGHFEAGYTTKAGLHVASYSSRRTGTIEAVVMSNRLLRSRCPMTTAQLAQLRTALDHTKARIELIQKEK